MAIIFDPVLGKLRSSAAVAFADITGLPADNSALSSALGAKADKSASGDITFAAGKGPVLLAPDSTKNRLEISNAKVLNSEEIA